MTEPVVRELAITNKRGLHARASAKFVQCVERFQAIITVTRNAETVGGNSIMGLMMLAAGPGYLRHRLRPPALTPLRRMSSTGHSRGKQVRRGRITLLV